MNRLPIAIAQLNFTVGDVDANVDKMLDAAHRARSELDCRVVILNRKIVIVCLWF